MNNFIKPFVTFLDAKKKYKNQLTQVMESGFLYPESGKWHIVDLLDHASMCPDWTEQGIALRNKYAKRIDSRKRG